MSFEFRVMSFCNAFHILVFHLGMRSFFVWLWLHKQDGTILIVKVEQKKIAAGCMDSSKYVHVSGDEFDTS